MDPSGSKNGDGRNRESASQVERRLRSIRAAEGRTLRSRRSSRNSNNSNSARLPRPEEAPSNNNEGGIPRRASAAAAAAADPPAADDSMFRFAAAAAAVRPNRSRSSDDNTEDDNDDTNASGGASNSAGGGDNNNPLLTSFLRHLREYCRDEVPSASAINVDKARNILEACAGNVALAGQLYWDDYFASQQHEQLQPAMNNPPPPPPFPPPPLEAPSAAAAAEAPMNDPNEDDDRGVRRRLDNIFERLLPAAQQHAAEERPRAGAGAADADGLEVRLPRRRRRRRRQEAAAQAAAAEPAVPAEIAAVNPGNIPNDDIINNLGALGAVARRAQPPRQPENNNNNNPAAVAVAEDAAVAGGAEASVSVSDDEAGVAGVLRMVRGASGRSNASVGRSRRKRRRRSSSFEDSNRELIRAREVLYARFAEQVEGPAVVERLKRHRDSKKVGSGKGDGDDGGGDDSDSSGSDNDIPSDDDEDAYLSENDWILNSPSRNPAASSESSSTTSQPAQNLRSPLKTLWGGLLGSPDAAPNVPNDDDNKDKDGNLDKPTEDEPETHIKVNLPDGRSVKIKVEEEASVEGGDDGDNEGGDNPKQSKHPEIPSTWLHASFSPHSTGMGLALKAPEPGDVAENSWRLVQLGPDPASANHRRNNAIPLPFHCRAVTAVLSVVTAMIYTGVSVQSNQLTCSSSRVPFLELSEADRVRDFENRLVDALQAIIFVAAKASTERKKKAVAKQLARKNRQRQKKKRKKKDLLEDEEEDDAQDEEDLAFQMNLERKLKLCPVAWWKENQTNAPEFPAEQWQASLDDSSHTGPRIQVGVSFSNISDIRAYVLSNMRAFTAPGGVALLLETIVGIHGEGAIKRMIEKSKAGDDKSSKDQFLVNCTCEKRQRIRLQDPSARRKLMNALDTTPPGHECVSTELVSLILTGKIHSSLKGWSTEQLGFGMLSRNAGEVGKVLSRPGLPVWVLKGETCFSVLLLDHTNHGENLDEERNVAEPSPDSNGPAKNKAKKNRHILGPSHPKAAPRMKMALCSNTSRSRDMQQAREFAQLDKPGTVSNLSHWNCWFGCRNLTSFRLITARPKWSPPSPSWVVAHYKTDPNAKHSSSLSCVRKPVSQQLQETRLASSLNVVSADEACETEAPVDEAAVERIRSNADDMKFYPNQHRMWRFDMGEKDGEEADLNSKPRGDHWVPYYSLNSGDQFLVEMKFGPQINRILWNRWPGATIDKFTPGGKKDPFPVV